MDKLETNEPKHDLLQLYKGHYFARRYKLSWRVGYVCPAIVDALHPTSLIDAGCAIGEFVDGFLKLGVDAYGLEGTANVVNYIVLPRDRLYIGDLRTPITLGKRVDLALCLEVAEHIEPEYVEVFLDNLTRFSNQVLMSFAPPGQEGHGHWNCQEASYWIEKMAKRGYVFRSEVVDKVREGLEAVKTKREIRSYYNNLLFFEGI